MTLNQWLLLIGLFLILIDLFFETDIPTLVSFILFTAIICHNLSGWHIMLRLIVAVIVFFAFVFLYYFLWMKWKKHFVDKWFAKDILPNGVDALVGEKGTVRIIDGVQAAKIHGDLYPFKGLVDREDGTPFIVKEIQAGMIVPEFASDTKVDEKL